MPENTQASYLIDLAGGPSNALQKAREYAGSHTMDGWQMALTISAALRRVAPSHEADVIYVQTLKMMGYSQESGQLRNWYLLTAKKAEAAMN